MKRNIRYIVVHCTATSQDVSLKALQKTWKEKTNDKTPPYHYLIRSDGELKRLVHENCIEGGDFSQNIPCIHVAFTGGINKEGQACDNRTKRQNDALFKKLVELSDKYSEAEIVGAVEISSQAETSPCFDVKKWMREYTPDFLEQPFFESLEYIEDIAA